MYDMNSHNEVEAFILKWTLVTVYTGVTLIFVAKILTLCTVYVTSGKIVADIGKYIIEGFKSVIHIGIGG